MFPYKPVPLSDLIVLAILPPINLKGEITVVISNVDETKKNKESLDESVKMKIKNLMNKLTIKDIVSIIGSENNISKSAIYKYCLKLKNEK